MSRVVRSCRMMSPGESPRRSFTLIEAVISIVISAVLLVAALNTVGAAAMSRHSSVQRTVALGLAEDLMAEILENAYEDPDDVTVTLGPDAGESSGGSRTAFDDVDDFETASRPIEDRNGNAIPGYARWSCRVTTRWVQPTDLGQTSSGESGVKRFKVRIEYDGDELVELVALRTRGWPSDARAQGPAIEVLFVVTNDASPTAQEQARRTLLESFGFTVTLVPASSTQAAMVAATAGKDVAYVSREIDPLVLDAKLRDATIGVVNERAELFATFGFAQDAIFKSRDEIAVIDDSHYITAGFGLGTLTTLSSAQPVHMMSGNFAPDLEVLAESYNIGSGWKASLATIETGGMLVDSGTAAGRRVQLPWGASGFDIAALNTDGQTIMRRAVEWAASKEQTAP